jgi:hypothetical protein
MPLRARVGRHANTGVHCQNVVEDQLWVIMELNLIPTADGGAQGSLTDDLVRAGVASDALYNAILRFQKKQFPAQQSGFVDPGGAVLARMEMLAERAPPVAPAAAPKPSGQWGEFKSGSVQRALYQALTDGPQLTHEKVVDALWSTLSNGTVSTSELDDLEMVAAKSRTIAPRSKALLGLFVERARSTMKAYGPYKLATSRQIDAAEHVCNFLRRVGRGRWPNLDRDRVGVGILMRLAHPRLVDQASASLCGPAAFVFSELQDHPVDYAGLAIDLYEQGTAKLRGLLITPNAAVRQYSPSGEIAPVDWLTMASLRDSENWFFTYDTADRKLAGITIPSKLADWFARAGYSDVRSDANLATRQRDTDNMDEASRLFSAGYRVCLFIDAQLLETPKLAPPGVLPQYRETYNAAENSGSYFMDRHWVVLRSRIDRSGGNVKMTVYTWGDDDRAVPPGGVPLQLESFLVNYYGYVAAKP